MAQILIRNLPNEVVARFRAKAELAGKSLEQTVRELIIAHSPLSPAERLSVSRRLREASGGPHPPLTRDEIRDGLL